MCSSCACVNVAPVWAWHSGAVHVLPCWLPEVACPLSRVTFDPIQVLQWEVKFEAMAVNDTSGIVLRVGLEERQ